MDEAPGTTGLLIVSGGNEIRGGAHRGMALLAAHLADQGHPVLRFDRRGVGDSMGENRGWNASAADIAAAAATFRDAVPHLRRVVAFGNCDAATALAFFGETAGVDALILSNPWLEDRGADGLPSAPAIRARYRARLRDPAAWRRAVGGGIDFRLFLNGMRKILGTRSEPDTAAGMAAELSRTRFTLILAADDATAQTFDDAWRAPTFDQARRHGTVVVIPTASHSYARPGDAAQLEAAILSALRR